MPVIVSQRSPARSVLKWHRSGLNQSGPHVSTTSRSDSEGSTRLPRLVVSLATYNEAGNMVPLVREQLPDVHVIHRSGKLGLGTAILEAMRFAIREGYDQLLNLDADFSHPPRFIPDLLAGMDRFDVMIGSRYVPGGGVDSALFNTKRKLMSWGINTYARLLLGLPSKDNSGSYRCYRVSKLAEMDLDRVRSRGYSFMEEILYWCRLVGCRIGETPIIFEDRRAGKSKINTLEVIRALEVILRLALSRPFHRRPSRSQSPALRV